MKAAPQQQKVSSPLPRPLVGKMAAILMFAGTVISISAEVVTGHLHERMVVSGGLSLLAGVILWLLPWDRMGSRGTLGFFIFGIAALVLGTTSTGDDVHAISVPVFLMALFAWNGLAHARWMSVKLAPLVAIVYVAPILLDPEVPFTQLFDVVFTVPFAVLIGETIAWITARLTTAENETLLMRHRADFLTAAQHELRTPLTTINGYARVLMDRGESLSSEQRREFLKAISGSVERMESLLRRLDDVQNLRGKGSDLTDLGLLAPHYGDEDIDLEDPLRGSTDDEHSR